RFLRRELGQALTEALVAAPLLFAFVMVVSGLCFSTWMRLELSQLVQSLGACLESVEPRHNCLGNFRKALGNLPGGWRLLGIQAERGHISVDLVSAAPSFVRWRTREPKPWLPPGEGGIYSRLLHLPSTASGPGSHLGGSAPESARRPSPFAGD